MGDDRNRLVVVNWRDVDHPQAGGAELVCHEFARLAVAEGYVVTMLAARVKGTPSEQTRDGYRVRRRGGRFTVYLWALGWLLVHRYRIDAVLDSQNGIPFFTPLVIRRRTPIILLLHHIHQEQFSEYFSVPVASLGRLLEGRVCRRVYGGRVIVAVSPSTRQGARKVLHLRGEIRIVPPGWRLSGPPQAQRSCRPEIVCVGRLVRHKRTKLIIDAMPDVLRLHPLAQLHVVGSGSEDASLRQLAAELGVSDAVTFHGSCSDQERDAVVSTAWLAVTASAGEGWGISVIEANALGTPVLAFDRPGLRDSIKTGETGWLIPEGASLGTAICEQLTLLTDPKAYQATRAASLRWADNFTWERMGFKILAVIASERSRLGLPNRDRRQASDVATVVDVPARNLPANWEPTLRVGDSVETTEYGLRIFLLGADSDGAKQALARLGLRSSPGDGTRLRVARGSDHLQAFERVGVRYCTKTPKVAPALASEGGRV